MNILVAQEHMKKGKKKRNEPKTGICNMPYISKNRLVEIQTEAFYRALKRIKEDEAEEKEINNSGVDKWEKFDDLLFFCNLDFDSLSGRKSLQHPFYSACSDFIYIHNVW